MTELIKGKIGEFKNLLLANNKSPNTVKNYISRVNKFIEANNIEDLKSVTTTLILEYFAKMSTTTTQATLNGHIEVVNQFCEFHKLEGLNFPKQAEAVSSRIKKPITEKELETLIEPQLSYLFSNPLQTKALVYFLFYSGLRKNDVIHLKRKDFTMEESALSLYVSKQKMIKRIPLPINLKILLDKYFGAEAEESNAFNTSEEKIKIIIDKLEQAEVLGKGRKLWAHLFRDSFACMCLNKGVSLPNLKLLMGHKRIEHTMKYLTLCDCDVNKDFLDKVKGVK